MFDISTMTRLIQKIVSTIFLIALMATNSIAKSTEVNDKNNSKYYQKFHTVFERLSSEYVNEADKEKMLDSALSGMLTSLDPHSSYYDEKEFEDVMNYTKGEFGGIGVEMIFDNGAIKVISPIDDLPADKAGIKAGDYIVGVNDESINQLGFNKAIKELRGDPGTKVKVTVMRDGENKPLDFELTRDIVKITSVKHKIDGEIAYVRIVTFNEHTISEFKKSMKAIIKDNKANLKGIILDLRNNPGGIVESAVDVAEYFIESGVILTSRGRTASSQRTYSASKFATKAPEIPIVVLINAGSASGSEILAGALQDYKRAIILGTDSFGKGSVQILMGLGDKTGLKYTIARYYTPNGRSIQAEGIKPDIYVEQANIEYPEKVSEKRFSESSLKNHLKKEDDDKKSSKKSDNSDKANKRKVTESSDMYKKDYQYARAYDLIMGLHITNNNKND